VEEREGVFGGGGGEVVGTEPTPSLVVDYSELVRGKLKKCKGFLKPNFELGPKLTDSNHELDICHPQERK
jgi:hypothetical protein